MGLRGVGSQPLSVRHPGLTEQTSLPAAPGWRTHAQRCWLLYGYDPKWAGAFTDEADYRAAWARNRETLMQECGPGRRPIAWWVCEGPCRYPGFDRETMVLLEGGFLREDEIRELRLTPGASSAA